LGFLSSVLAPLAMPSVAQAVGPVSMPVSEITWIESPCRTDKGEMLKGTMATFGLQARCVEATATVVNPNDFALDRPGVFGRIDDKAIETSVLANAMDGASDVGQFTMIEEIPPGKQRVTFRFVAALPKSYAGKPIPELAFRSMKAIWYPGGNRFEPMSQCDMNPTADGCDEYFEKYPPTRKKQR